MSSMGGYIESKCFSCRKATGVCKCSWAESFTPVKGWDAEPTKIHMFAHDDVDSFLVRECPEYEQGHDDVKLDEMDVHNLACAAILQAVEDWKALEYGKIEARKFLNQRIKKSDLIAFFYCREFKMLLHMALPEYTPDQIRRALRVPNRVWGVVR